MMDEREFAERESRYANLTDDEIEAECAEVEPGKRNRHRNWLRRQRKEAQRELLIQGAHAILTAPLIENAGARHWLMTFMFGEAESRKDRRTDAKPDGFHIAIEIENMRRGGKKVGESQEQIAGAKFLSPKRVKNIWQEYRKVAKSYWDDRETLITDQIMAMLDDGDTYGQAVCWVAEHNDDLSKNRIRKIYPNPATSKARK